MKIRKLKWTHFAEREPKQLVRYLVVHCFAFPIQKTVRLWNKLGVGPHYMIDRCGKITQFVPENKVAWHAGKSHWKDENNLNGSSIGIELYSPSFGQKPYPRSQLKAFEKLVKQIMKRHHIPAENVVGHSDVAPTRKVDPGIAFPWAEMAAKGIGVWPDGTKFVSCKKMNTLLREIGYDTTDERAALLAFLRHFMPERVTVDKEILKMEENLPMRIAAMPKADKEVKAVLNQVACAYRRVRRLQSLTLKRGKG